MNRHGIAGKIAETYSVQNKRNLVYSHFRNESHLPKIVYTVVFGKSY
jgi:hypothetical protein